MADRHSEENWARQILAIDIGAEGKLRLLALQEKRKVGSLSAAEAEEAHGYEEALQLISGLKSKTRKILGLRDDEGQP